MTPRSVAAPMPFPASPRVLHLASSERWTGVAEPLCSLAAHQSRLGAETWVGCIPSRSFEREAKRLGLRMMLDCYFDRGANPLRPIHDILVLRRFVRQQGIDVVHCHLANDHWLAALAVRGLGRRVLLVRTVHRRLPPKADPLHRWLFHRATDLTVAVSAESHDELTKWLGPSRARQARLVAGAVDLQRFHPSKDGAAIRRELGVPPDAILAGNVARMVEGRGHVWLLRAFEAAAARAPQLWLALIGRGPLKKALREARKKHPFAGRIVEAGYRKDDLDRMYGALDFHLLLGAGSDGSCRAALEAMAAGKANIALAEGALLDSVKPGETGLLVPRGDVEALAEALVRLGSDREEARRMGAAARRDAEARFGEERRARETLEAYRAVWAPWNSGRS